MQNVNSEIGFILSLLNEPNFNNIIVNTKVLGDDRNVTGKSIQYLNEAQVYIALINQYKDLGLSEDNRRRVEDKLSNTANKTLIKDLQDSILELSQPKDTVELVNLILLESIYNKKYVEIIYPLIKEEIYSKYVILTHLFLYKLKKEYVIKEGEYTYKHLKKDYFSFLSDKDIQNINEIGKSLDNIFSNILNLEIDDNE